MSPLFGAGLTSPGGIGKATVTSTTGSPTVNNNARAGKTIYTFNGSGSITFGTAGNIEALLVGGGGGGARYGGGGGAGGVLYDAEALVPAETITLTVGAGGICGTSNQDHGRVGGPSALGNYVALGGGTGTGGSYNTIQEAGGGGSGGGAVSGTGGTGFVNQGKNGGNAYGGGGGAGNNGNNGNANAPGTGGNGVAYSITGTSITYGGGGGGQGNNGGAGGSGGGAAGGTANGTDGLGGGGGGSTGSNSRGGNGVVIVVTG
jgi:hypothetical protein